MSDKKLATLGVIFLSSVLFPDVAVLAKDVAASLELEFASIPPGTFQMGADLPADVITAERAVFIQDELPAREVTITNAFEMSKFEITNAQYEKYDPGHAALRGKAHGLSRGDREAVVYVDWQDATGFCRWLSEQDERYDYRLPTEAEWEYACRAGTRTPYNDGVSGDIYSLEPLGDLAAKWNLITDWLVTRGNRPTESISWGQPKDVDLTIGQEKANRWGLHDMHGSVQEWTNDWYGPYVASDRSDPVGYASGDSKVVRGGCHNVYIQTLRSANRSSSVRTDKHFLLGFRPVRVPKGQRLPEPKLVQPVPAWAQDVSQKVYSWPADDTKPRFRLESLYSMATEYGSRELAQQFKIPLYTHNHSPAITWMSNGDLLLIWFSGESEKGQELTIVGVRGRRTASGELAWDPQVSEFYKEADRNVHGSQLWNNAPRLAAGFKEPLTLYHVNGSCTDGKWSKLAMSFRTSTDNGVTWTEPLVMKPETDAFHLEAARNQPQGDAFTATNGALVSFSDGSAKGVSGSSVNFSNDGGKTWSVRGDRGGPPGIHVASVELSDGRILVFSRDKGKTFDKRLPRSLSSDQGKTWTHSASDFPSISTVQRAALLRLEYSSPKLDPEGLDRKPLLLVSIASDGLEARDANGEVTTIHGSFAALSWDEGKTWPLRRVLSDVRSGAATYLSAPWNRAVELTPVEGQGKAYWAATQAPDGTVHLSDGRLVYAFNLAWVVGNF